ncbi:hypothetical protein ZIOFF_064582 [Zingiber officinale]|uniref:Uncharacterized protein n=1 Tax=Zingiber officinale TaxID=94328 RepID=A0A8J5K6R4_ZINOF|nr:hypothetical protein ZIOFF_064582 [Zingiber officinale]
MTLPRIMTTRETILQILHNLCNSFAWINCFVDNSVPQSILGYNAARMLYHPFLASLCWRYMAEWANCALDESWAPEGSTNVRQLYLDRKL